MAALQTALLLAVAGRFLLDRTTQPRGWARTAPVDPALPVRGRYVSLRLEAPAPGLEPRPYGAVGLAVRNGRVEARIPAKVVGYDRIFDLALVKAELTPEYVFSSAADPELKVGNPILAIGSPAGLENTVTAGIVSATGRRFLQLGDTVQVDVPINYGNSGGPLLDTGGHLVGVVGL